MGIVSFFVLLPYLCWTNEIVFFMEISDEKLTKRMLINSLICYIQTYMTLLAIKTVGPLGINITNILKDVLLTYISFIIFTEIQPSFEVLFGLACSFIGAIYYIYHKITFSQNEINEKKKTN